MARRGYGGRVGDIGPESAHYEVLPVIDDVVAPRVDVVATTDAARGAATGTATIAAGKAVVQVAAAEPAAGR